MNSNNLELKVFNWNIRGLSCPKKVAKIRLMLARFNVDIAVLTETNRSPSSPPLNLPGYFLFESSAGRGTGVVVAIRHSFSEPSPSATIDTDGRYVRLSLRSPFEIDLLALYLPAKHSERKAWLLRHSLLLSTASMVLGDLNSPPNSVKWDGKFIANIINSRGLREVLPTNSSFTFSGPQGDSLLDRLLYDPTALGLVPSGCSVLDKDFSDHHPVLTTLARPVAPSRRLPIPWRLPSAFKLDNPKIIRILESFITETWSLPHNLVKKWFLIKAGLKSLLRRISRLSSDPSSTSLDDLYRRLLATPTDDPGFATTSSSIQAAKEHILNTRLRNDRLASLLGPEAPGSFITARSRARDNKISISSLRIDGEITSNPSKIDNYVHSYFSDLLSTPVTSPPSSSFPFVPPHDMRRETMAPLVSKISTDEVTEKILKAPTSSSPGPDGIPYSIYKALVATIAPILTSLFNHLLSLPVLPRLFSRGITFLLRKKNSDPLNLADFRPITLLNCDYKLLASILENRLSSSKIAFSPFQFGFTKNRSILAPAVILDTLLHNHVAKGQGAVLLVDFRKAFDSVSHDHIINTLRSLDCPSEFSRWIALLLHNSSTVIATNGRTTPPIAIKRGTKQGDPISPRLFNLAILPLLHSLHYLNPGLLLSSNNHPLARVSAVAYADDLAIYLANLDDLPKVISLLEEFEKISGITVNAAKSILVSKNAISPSLFPTLDKNDFFTYLGFRFSIRGFDSSLPHLHSSILSALSRLQPLAMTPRAAAVVLKFYLQSKMTHLLIALPSHKTFPLMKILLEASDSILFDSHSLRLSRMKFSRLYPPTSAGGLGITHLPSFKSAASTSFFRRTLADPYNPLTAAWYDNLNRKTELPLLWELHTTSEKFPPSSFPHRTALLYRLAMGNSLHFQPTPGQLDWAKKFGVNWSSVWRKINSIKHPRARALVWKLYHRALPGKRHGQECRTCGLTESTLHIFFECSALTWIPSLVEIDWTPENILPMAAPGLDPDHTAAILMTIWIIRNKRLRGLDHPPPAQIVKSYLM